MVDVNIPRKPAITAKKIYSGKRQRKDAMQPKIIETLPKTFKFFFTFKNGKIIK